MANAHVICPVFFGRYISNPQTSNIFFSKILASEDQIVIDREERLIFGYLDSVKDDAGAFEKYKAWIALLNESVTGKKLISSSLDSSNTQETVFNTISQAITTHDKSIIIDDANCYAGFIGEINRQRINMFHLHDLTNGLAKKKFTRLTGYANFEDDLYWALHRTARMSKKSCSEDEVNDLLREMLASMGRANGYEIRDQAREGTSQSKKGAGELDLLIENCGFLYTILESMRVANIDKEYIKKHYSKLLNNYNPLGVYRTYLISYYNGTNFEGWWCKYQKHIKESDPSDFTDNATSQTEGLIFLTSPYNNLRQMQHVFRSNGQIYICTHFGINLVENLK
ncbi:hypothetical protein AO260_32530 [Pseudomonas sp. ABAC21]|nr:hypothetical protein AO260_32530 [Pseudomonas sp. ABAC21]